jgi:hypothetical protein
MSPEQAKPVQSKTEITPSGEITLRSGRKITLERLVLSKTYAGLVEGYPNHDLNRRLIERVVDEERKKTNPRHEPYVVPPVESPIPYHRYHRTSTGSSPKLAFGEPVSLPKILCIGRFESGPAKDKSADGSVLSVLWFQNQFALPIETTIVERIQELDWDRLAVDYDKS